MFAHLFHLQRALCSPLHTSVSTVSCYHGPWPRQGAHSIIEIIVIDELEFGETSGKNFGLCLWSLTGVQKVPERSWKGENLRLKGYNQKRANCSFSHSLGIKCCILLSMTYTMHVTKPMANWTTDFWHWFSHLTSTHKHWGASQKEVLKFYVMARVLFRTQPPF